MENVINFSESKCVTTQLSEMFIHACKGSYFDVSEIFHFYLMSWMVFAIVVNAACEVICILCYNDI